MQKQKRISDQQKRKHMEDKNVTARLAVGQSSMSGICLRNVGESDDI